MASNPFISCLFQHNESQGQETIKIIRQTGSICIFISPAPPTTSMDQLNVIKINQNKPFFSSVFGMKSDHTKTYNGAAQVSYKCQPMTQPVTRGPTPHFEPIA